MAGTQPLPESQLDRFMICLQMGYPTASQQLRILKNRSVYDLSSLHPILDRETLLDMQKAVYEIRMAHEVMVYIVALCEETRTDPLVELGVSPRGVIALADMAKACALVRGRSYVIPEDVQEVFPDVCSHRLMLKPKARMDEISAKYILLEIMRRVNPPDRAKPRRRK